MIVNQNNKDLQDQSALNSDMQEAKKQKSSAVFQDLSREDQLNMIAEIVNSIFIEEFGLKNKKRIVDIGPKRFKYEQNVESKEVIDELFEKAKLYKQKLEKMKLENKIENHHGIPVSYLEKIADCLLMLFNSENSVELKWMKYTCMVIFVLSVVSAMFAGLFFCNKIFESDLTNNDEKTIKLIKTTVIFIVIFNIISYVVSAFLISRLRFTVSSFVNKIILDDVRGFEKVIANFFNSAGLFVLLFFVGILVSLVILVKQIKFLKQCDAKTFLYFIIIVNVFYMINILCFFYSNFLIKNGDPAKFAKLYAETFDVDSDCLFDLYNTEKFEFSNIEEDRVLNI